MGDPPSSPATRSKELHKVHGAENGRRFVPWNALLPIILGIVGVGGATMTFVWSQHAGHPHKGSVTQEEMQRHDAMLRQMEKRFEQAFSHSQAAEVRLEKKLDKIQDDITAIARRVK